MLESTTSVETDKKYEEIKLMPGELYIADKKPARIWTVLGSCVSVVLYSKALRTGAACHGQLPEALLEGKKCSDGCPHSGEGHRLHESRFRFVSCSVRHIIDSFAERGIRDACAVIIGGSSVFSEAVRFIDVAGRNVEVAEKLLSDYRIPVLATRTGGKVGRSLYFHTDTGELSIKMDGVVEEFRFAGYCEQIK